MLMTDCTLMSSKEPPLQKGNYSMDTRQQMLAFWLATLHMSGVNETFHAAIGIQSIGCNRTAGLYGLLNKPMQTCFGYIRNATKPDTPDAFAVLFSSHNNQSFFLGQAAK